MNATMNQNSTDILTQTLEATLKWEEKISVFMFTQVFQDFMGINWNLYQGIKSVGYL